ncbi:hypothetical protein [Lewinella sp. W8]|nr:hypothetical protein [Lewinella sp. W8]
MTGDGPDRSGEDSPGEWFFKRGAEAWSVAEYSAQPVRVPGYS